MFTKEELDILFTTVDYTINTADDEHPVDADLVQLIELRRKLKCIVVQNARVNP